MNAHASRPPAPLIEASGPHIDVNLDAIAHNVGLLREHAGSAAVMAVLKADGYGHGAVRVAQAALTAGAGSLGVATLGEALALRHGGVTAPVLAWLHPPGPDFAAALRADVQVAISSARQLDELLAAVYRTRITASVTVKVDTGMNRNGAGAAEYSTLLTAVARASAAGAIRVHGLMSHLSHGDDPTHPANDIQAQRLVEMRAQAKRLGVNYEIVHLANSAATMSRPDLAFDLVRPGIAVYGQTPLPQRGDMDLIPAMTLSCPVALVKPMAAGEGVSYGHAWIARRDTNVALLPIGYADGVFRSLSGRLEVLINGKRRPSVGQICMDQLVVDIGTDHDVAVGDQAILFGPGDAGELRPQDWADALDTISYEIVSSPRGRLTRRYRGGGCPGKVPSLIPKSRAVAAIDLSGQSNTSFTASSRYSGENFRRE
ncbi:Alanine racemase [Mycobacterium sp. smrl_JER01]